MNTFAGMSWATFDENRNGISTAVKLLHAEPKRRRQFQLVTVHEKSTGELLLEVLATSFGPVVVYSTGIQHASQQSIWVKSRQDRDGRSVDPLTGDANQRFSVTSHSSATYDVWAIDLIRVITGDVDPATLPNHAQFARLANVIVQVDGDGVGALSFKRVATKR